MPIFVKFLFMKRSSWVVDSVVGLNDSPWRWFVGVQAGLAMGLPLIVFTVAGHQSLGLIASLGAFTALYCIGMRWVDQFKILPLIALGLVATSFFGVLCAFSLWWTLFCLIVVALLACILVLGLGIGSPGALMFVLVAAVSNYVAFKGGFEFSAVGIFLIPLLVAAGGFLSFLVVVLINVLPSGILPRRARATSHRITSYPRLDGEGKEITSRVVVAVALAGLLAAFIHIERSYWVIIPAIAILQSTYARRFILIRAIHRFGGTVIGVFIFGLIVYWQPDGFALIGIIMFLQFAIEVVVARNYGLALIFITPVALTISTVGQQDEIWSVIQARVLDTLLGAVVALLVIGGGEGLKFLRSLVRKRRGIGSPKDPSLSSISEKKDPKASIDRKSD